MVPTRFRKLTVHKRLLFRDPETSSAGDLGAMTDSRPRYAATFAAFRHPNYRLYFSGQIVSLVGTWMQIVAQGWLVYQLTNSPLYLGLVSFASSVPVVFLSLGAGAIIDRLPRRRVLVMTQTSAMLLAFVLAFLTFTGLVQPWQILILSFLLGVVNAFDGTARQTFVKDMVGKEDLMNAIALNSATFNTSRLIGPALAGLALATVGAGWCFLLNGLSFLAVIIALLRMKLPPFEPPAQRGPLGAQIREGLHYIRHDVVVLPVMGLVVVSSVFGFSYNALLPAYARDILGVGAQGLGLLSAAVGVGALVGALWVASSGRSQHKGWLLTAGSLFFPVMLCLLALTNTFAVAMLVLVGAGLGFMVQNATANTLVQTTVPDELRGRVMSVYMLAFFGMSPLGSLQAGVVAERWGVPAGIGLGAVIALVFALWLTWRVPSLRKVP